MVARERQSGDGRVTGGKESLRARDDLARRTAQSDFDNPLVVIAGAGTGKTALLVSRVIAWCIGPGWLRHQGNDRSSADIARDVMQRVVAITFTEAAAAEMAQRIAEALSRIGLGDGGWPPGWMIVPFELPAEQELRIRAESLAEEVHRLQVQTIHSFCQALLSSFPLESGLHSRFTVDAEGEAVDSVITETVETALRSLRDQHFDEWTALARRGVAPAQVARGVRILLERGVSPEELRAEVFDRAGARAARERLAQSIEAFLAAGGNLLTECGRSKSSEAVAKALIAAGETLANPCDEPGYEWLASVVADVSTAAGTRVKDWARGKFNKTERQRLGEHVDDVSEAASELQLEIDASSSLDVEGHRAARSLLAPLLEDVIEELRFRGIVTFEDLLRECDRLLESSPQVCRAVRGRFDQLLVDEFQDTNDVQCRIVERLTTGSEDSPCPNLFVVGDPKQSIYSFRQADLGAFDDFVERLVGRGGRRLYLSRNFRSGQGVLDEVERVIAPVMCEERGLQPPFQRLEAAKEEEGVDTRSALDSEPEVEHWVQWVSDDQGGLVPAKRVGDALRLEAEALARDLCRLHDSEGVSWGQAAVLVRARTKQEVILEAFRRYGVPFEVARERDYYRQREVVDTAALVRCILEPGDTLSLLTVLRSGVVGVPDFALAPLWDAGFEVAMSKVDGADCPALEEVSIAVDKASRLVVERGGTALPHWPESVLNAAEVIARLRTSFLEDAPDRWIEHIRLLWLPELAAASRYLGRFRVARLERLFERLEKSLVATGQDRAAVARFLRVAVEEGRESELPPEPDSATDAVQVMTIHTAKGLGFDHVFLVQTQRDDPRRTGDRPVEALPGAAGLELSLFGMRSPGFVAAAYAKKRRERAERVRLLYVAMTRAKRRLVVSGGWTSAGVQVKVDEAANFGQLIGHRLSRSRMASMIEDGKGSVVEEETGVRWVFPALGPRIDEAERSSEREAERPDLVERICRDSAALARARADAATRSARRISGRASGAAHDSKMSHSLELTPQQPASEHRTRDVALGIGTRVHALLEDLDLTGDLEKQIDESLAELTDGRSATDEVAEGVAEMLAKLRGGSLLNRLAGLAPHVVARELPVLMPPVGAEGPVGFISGTVDLVYCDPSDGSAVVADYKTDFVDSDEGMLDRAGEYRPQLEVYAAALREALGLDDLPRMELWFLAADRVVVL